MSIDGYKTRAWLVLVAGLACGTLGCEDPPAAVDVVPNTDPKPSAQSAYPDGARPTIDADKTWSRTSQFGVFWPPRNASKDLTGSLFQGEVAAFQTEEETGKDAFRIHLTLTRSAHEDDRNRWNKALAFPSLLWMVHVKVWDDDNKWLWPNLPFLLRAHGRERIDRYGGIDPEKDVDNDFAAVLIRPLQDTGSGQHEPITNVEPLVSAEWYPVNARGVDRKTVVHVARSDDFRIGLQPEEGSFGHLGVWLIYADFMGAAVPRNWPKQLEYAGGILAYLEVSWRRDAESHLEVTMKNLPPPSGTGFEWEEWSTIPKAHEKNLELKLLPAVNTAGER